MLKHVTRVVVALALALAAPPVAAAQPSSSAPGLLGARDDVAARVGDRVITLGDVDEAWREANAAEQAQTAQAVYTARRQALDKLVGDILIERAAKARGLSAERFEAEETAKRVKPVTDGEIAALYEQNRGRMQGKSLDEMRGPIRSHLEEQQQRAARQGLVAELRKAGPAVTVALDPPRQKVDIAAADPSRGRANAAVVLVEFSDYQCPFCARIGPTISKLRDAYGDRVRFVWKDFPLTSIHPLAFKAAEAAHCAGDQGKYWEYHDRLFANQQQMQVSALKKHAADLGMDATAFGACLDAGKHADRVRDGLQSGSRLGVRSTPSVFINGRLVRGAQSYEAFEALIEDELDRAKRR
jgi:protein-disulfide isomerase